MAEPQLDLNKLIASGGLQISSEHDAERASRLAREEADARVERHKGLVRFYAVLLAGSIVFGLAVYVGFWDTDASPDARKWAMAVLAAFVTGPAGYFIGQKTK